MQVGSDVITLGETIIISSSITIMFFSSPLGLHSEAIFEICDSPILSRFNVLPSVSSNYQYLKLWERRLVLVQYLHCESNAVFYSR
jgi:hypothetical protein